SLQDDEIESPSGLRARDLRVAGHVGIGGHFLAAPLHLDKHTLGRSPGNDLYFEVFREGRQIRRLGPDNDLVPLCLVDAPIRFNSCSRFMVHFGSGNGSTASSIRTYTNCLPARTASTSIFDAPTITIGASIR